MFLLFFFLLSLSYIYGSFFFNSILFCNVSFPQSLLKYPILSLLSFLEFLLSHSVALFALQFLSITNISWYSCLSNFFPDSISFIVVGTGNKSDDRFIIIGYLFYSGSFFFCYCTSHYRRIRMKRKNYPCSSRFFHNVSGSLREIQNVIYKDHLIYKGI